jgi:hypothetical protein
VGTSARGSTVCDVIRGTWRVDPNQRRKEFASPSNELESCFGLEHCKKSRTDAYTSVANEHEENILSNYLDNSVTGKCRYYLH